MAAGKNKFIGDYFLKYQVFYHSIVSMIRSLPDNEIRALLKTPQSFSRWFSTFEKEHLKENMPIDKQNLYRDLVSFFQRVCPLLLLSPSVMTVKEEALV